MSNLPAQGEEMHKLFISVRVPWALSLAMAGLLTSLDVNAVDYSRYTSEELAQMRTRVRDMDEQDRQQYSEEMYMRMQNMSVEERVNPGLGNAPGRTDGSAAGDGNHRLRSNEDNSEGRGVMMRRRSRTETGSTSFGSGYEQRQIRGSGRGR